ncbi:MAG: response regulator [Opitutaceae bacterium]
MNILLIEDEEELLEMAVASLQISGYTVFPAVDIAQARAVLDSQEIQIVITDHRLPDGLGIQFAIEIQDLYPKAKIAIVSGCFTDSDIDEMGAHDLLYFSKPLLYANVVDKLRRHYAMKAKIVQMSKVEDPELDPNLKNV